MKITILFRFGVKKCDCFKFGVSWLIVFVILGNVETIIKYFEGFSPSPRPRLLSLCACIRSTHPIECYKM